MITHTLLYCRFSVWSSSKRSTSTRRRITDVGQKCQANDTDSSTSLGKFICERKPSELDRFGVWL